MGLPMQLQAVATDDGLDVTIMTMTRFFISLGVLSGVVSTASAQTPTPPVPVESDFICSRSETPAGFTMICTLDTSGLPEPGADAADLVISGVKRYSARSSSNYWLVFNYRANRTLPRFIIEVAFNYLGGGVQTEEQTMYSGLKINEVGSETVIPDKLPTNWTSVDISVNPTTISCNGCRRYSNVSMASTNMLNPEAIGPEDLGAAILELKQAARR